MNLKSWDISTHPPRIVRWLRRRFVNRACGFSFVANPQMFPNKNAGDEEDEKGRDEREYKRCASAFRCPWLVIGSVPPVDSITISDQTTPVLMWTDATFEIGMLSSFDPNSRDLVRITRCGLTTIRVGKKKLPCVQRDAAKVSEGEGSVGVIDSLGDLAIESLSELGSIARSHNHPMAQFFTPTPARLFARPRCILRSGWPKKSAFRAGQTGRTP